ncbi:SET domain-containing protein SmydA-8 [Tribolium castaneum]|uniref:Protein msta, isoform A-like Protein n=1 Tax=Tribolium castaneum TaxID=7070 RepID=D6WUY1_TRICA|nr:PREDICTED: protein msta, isoform B [Tribolium castaneum]EFA08507.1 Protein msta, isoform A-like Protein [Tribolium castaneum]|eukprot:XP_008196085.1 PREDICTED: protein msta, isoform B [Tribolium castaneum]
MSKHSRRKKGKSARRSQSQSTTSSENFEEGFDVTDDGPIFEVKTSKVMGRYMVSRKNLKPGDVILSEAPLVIGPCTGCKVQCLGCYKTLESSFCTKCTCGWPLCSPKCKGLGKRFGHSQVECAVLKATKSSKFLNYDNFEEMRPNFNAIVPLRCLLLKETDARSYQHLMTMETHNEIRRNIPELWQTNQRTVVDKIRIDWGLREYSQEEIHSVCGILEVNSFEIGQQGVNIRGLYPSAFLMSHDCVPNTNHIDEESTFRLTVRASTRIEPGEMITLSYAYTLQSTLKRREHLLENKFFECQCRRCSDPTELGTFTSALICPKCKDGFVLSSNPLDPEADWTCSNYNKCPGYKISAKSMQLLLDKITQEVDNIDCNDVITMETFLKKYRNVLHPTHYINLSVKLSLSQLYGRINGFLIDELSDEVLTRKLEICEEIIKVFNVIEPGFTRLRGVTLYEMHAPLMVLLTRQFERHCTKSELRSKLKKVLKCLEEASVILGYEPESSPEGMMGVAAKDALVKIRDWEKILGRF